MLLYFRKVLVILVILNKSNLPFLLPSGPNLLFPTEKLSTKITHYQIIRLFQFYQIEHITPKKISFIKKTVNSI